MKKKGVGPQSAAALLAVALLASSLCGCGKAAKTSSQKEQGKQVVLNEVAHSIFYAPMYVAIEEGYFEEEGLELTLVTGFVVRLHT